MVLRKAWQRTALLLGTGWSLLWGLVLSELPLVKQLDLAQQDLLIRLSRSRMPSEIVLVSISTADLKAWGYAQEPVMYASLVDRLFNAGAAVVVLNLLPNWLQTSDHANHPIKLLVQRHASQVTLVLPTFSAAQANPTEWRSYENFLPLTAQGNPQFPPPSILGFFEYEPEAETLPGRYNSSRQAYLTGQFTLTRAPDHREKLDSAALLSLKKFQSQTAPQTKLPLPPRSTPIQIRFWGPTGTFPTLKAEAVLSPNPSLQLVRHKIVLVGFTDIRNPDAFAIRSPFGDRMPAVEVQANLLASLLTGSFFRIVPRWPRGGLILLGASGSANGSSLVGCTPGPAAAIDIGSGPLGGWEDWGSSIFCYGARGGSCP